MDVVTNSLNSFTAANGGKDWTESGPFQSPVDINTVFEPCRLQVVSASNSSFTQLLLRTRPLPVAALRPVQIYDSTSWVVYDTQKWRIGTLLCNLWGKSVSRAS